MYARPIPLVHPLVVRPSGQIIEGPPNTAALNPSLYAYSYTGRKVGPDFDAPSLEDISVSLGRICRYAGNCVRFWPVLLHSFVVADLLPVHLKPYGLLHDASESVMSDVPRGFKTPDYVVVEKQIEAKILESFNLPPVTPEQQKHVKLADNEVLCAEVWTVGTSALRAIMPDRSPHAEELIYRYARDFPPEDCINPAGLAAMEFRRRVLNSISDIGR